MHNFISSGFVTLGRGHLKGKVLSSKCFLHFTEPCQSGLEKQSLQSCVMLSPSSCQMSVQRTVQSKKSNNVSVTFVPAQWKLDVTIHNGLK